MIEVLGFLERLEGIRGDAEVRTVEEGEAVLRSSY